MRTRGAVPGAARNALRLAAADVEAGGGTVDPVTTRSPSAARTLKLATREVALEILWPAKRSISSRR